MFITAQPRHWTARRFTTGTSALLNGDAQSFQEINADEKPLRAFCQFCSSRVVYQVRGFTDYAVLVYGAKRCLVSCKKCNHALFWTREYNGPFKITESEKAKFEKRRDREHSKEGVDYD
jgi:hypothetical protein